jgi:hypothetical protein
MALSAARASLRDEAPERGPRRMLDAVRVGVPHTTRNSCIGESPVIYQGAFRRRYQYQPDPGTSLGPLPAAYRGPVMHPASFVRPSPQTRRGSGPALYACENPARGVNRTSTQLYRVRTRSRLRVSFPLVAGSRGSTARRFRRVSCPASAGPQRHGTPTCHWGPGAHPPS